MKKIIYSTILIALCAVIYNSCDNNERKVKRVDSCGKRYKIPVKSRENITTHNTDSISNVLLCPKCKSDNTADIKYGLWARCGDEVADSLEKANGGRPVVPGGCAVKPYNHYCFNCLYQW